MISTTRTQRRYDHRLRELVCKAKDVDLAVRYGVPRSTARGWLAPTTTPVVTLNGSHLNAMRLQQEVVHLRRRVDCLVALLRLMALLLKLTGSSLQSVRLPEGRSKARLLQTIDRACARFSWRAVLRMIRLSNTRYHAWKRESDCALADRPCCPRRSPQQLTFDEVNAIRDMVTSDDYRHVPTGRLACLAQRLGKVFASPSTWFRLRPGRPPLLPAATGASRPTQCRHSRRAAQ